MFYSSMIFKQSICLGQPTGFPFSGSVPNYPDPQYKQIDQFFLSTLYSGQDLGDGNDICFNLKKVLLAIYNGGRTP